MEQLKPNDIPEVIVLVSELYNSRDKVMPTVEQKNRISTFFMRYMGKAIEDCQQLSKTHWSVTRPSRDVAFRTKAVKVKSEASQGQVEFIVGTSYGPQYDDSTRATFRRNTEAEILNLFSDPEDGSWVMTFNSVMFDTRNHGKFMAGLFVGVRFSSENFAPMEASPQAPSEPVQDV